MPLSLQLLPQCARGDGMLPNQASIPDTKIANDVMRSREHRSKQNDDNEQYRESFQRSMQDSMKRQQENDKQRQVNQNQASQKSDAPRQPDNKVTDDRKVTHTEAKKSVSKEAKSGEQAAQNESLVQNAQTPEDGKDNKKLTSTDGSKTADAQTSNDQAQGFFDPELSQVTFEQAMQQLLAQQLDQEGIEINEADIDEAISKLKQSDSSDTDVDLGKTLQDKLNQYAEKSSDDLSTESSDDSPTTLADGKQGEDKKVTDVGVNVEQQNNKQLHWLNDVLSIISDNKQKAQIELEAEQQQIKSVSEKSAQFAASSLINIDSNEQLSDSVKAKTSDTKPNEMLISIVSNKQLSDTVKQEATQVAQNNVKTDEQLNASNAKAVLSGADIIDKLQAARLTPLNFSADNKVSVSGLSSLSKEAAEKSELPIMPQIDINQTTKTTKSELKLDGLLHRLSQPDSINFSLNETKLGSETGVAEKTTYVEIAGVEINRTLQAAKVENVHMNRTEAVLRENILFNKQELANFSNQQIGMMLAKNLKSIDIRLDPPELGAMQIRMSVNNDQASISFVVNNQQAKDALENSLPKLKELFEQGGMQLADSDVQQQDDQSGETSEQSAQHNSGSTSEEEQNDVGQVGMRPVNINSPWRVDYFA